MAYVIDDMDAYLCSGCVGVFGNMAPDISNIITDAQKAGKEYIICPHCGERLKVDRKVEQMVDTDAYDYCYECTGYGDDYYIDEYGEFVCRCPECQMNPYRDDED